MAGGGDVRSKGPPKLIGNLSRYSGIQIFDEDYIRPRIQRYRLDQLDPSAWIAVHANVVYS